MFDRLLTRARRSEGFTLIELLIVVLIIGILAAIALPAFLGQRQKGQDAAAKSNARNLVSQMESCFTDNQTYTGCTGAGSGLPIGTGAGQVEISANSGTGYTVIAHSASGVNYTIQQNGSGRTCAPVSTGACPASGTW